MNIQEVKENCAKLVTSEEKWSISVVSGLIFLLISSPFLYGLTSSLFECFGLTLASSKGLPTNIGLLVHSVVFILIVRAMMK